MVMNNLEEAKKICVEMLLVPFEGYARKLADGSCEAYPDPASKLMRLTPLERNNLTEEDYEKLGRPWTIGYGSTYDADGTPVKPGDVWTQEKAVQVKQIILNKFLQGLLTLSPGLKDENPYKIAAVLSWVYNIGLGSYRISTYKKKIDSKEWEEAGSQGLLWNKAQGKVLKGLTLRRQAEQIFLNKDK
jgi:lysozyme